MTLKEEVEQPETDDEKVRRRLQQRREQSRRYYAKKQSAVANATGETWTKSETHGRPQAPIVYDLSGDKAQPRLSLEPVSPVSCPVKTEPDPGPQPETKPHVNKATTGDERRRRSRRRETKRLALPEHMKKRAVNAGGRGSKRKRTSVQTDFFDPPESCRPVTLRQSMSSKLFQRRQKAARAEKSTAELAQVHLSAGESTAYAFPDCIPPHLRTPELAKLLKRMNKLEEMLAREGRDSKLVTADELAAVFRRPKGSGPDRLRCWHGCNRSLHVGRKIGETKTQQMQMCHVIASSRDPNYKNHRSKALDVPINLLPGCADCNGDCGTDNAYDYAESVSNLSKQLTRQSHLTRNKLWKAVRILHREWVRTELPGLCPTLDCSTLQKPTIAP